MTDSPQTEAGRKHWREVLHDVHPSVVLRDVLAIEDQAAQAARAEIAELRPCPWCGHPPMCHKDGECVAPEDSDA